MAPARSVPRLGDMQGRVTIVSPKDKQPEVSVVEDMSYRGKGTGLKLSVEMKTVLPSSTNNLGKSFKGLRASVY